MIDERYGKLVVLRQGISRFHNTKERGVRECRRWVCQCDCGNIIERAEKDLIGGRCDSCLSCAYTGENNANYKHGASAGKRGDRAYAPEYRTWCAIKTRCYNPNSDEYYVYGGRGIQMCDAWLNSFEAFFDDMGPKPTPQHTIDRKNNDKGYCPDNCRWATDQEQRRNRRSNRRITIDNTTHCLVEWFEIIGTKKSTFEWRERQGWSIEESLFGRGASGHLIVDRVLKA